MSDQLIEELTLPATALRIAHTMAVMAGVQRVVIFRGRQAEDGYLGTMDNPTPLEMLNLPTAVVRKFGPGHYRLVGKRGEEELAIVLLDASDRPLVTPVRH